MTPRHDAAAELAKGYAPAHRAYEYAGIAGAIVCAAWLVARISREPLPAAHLVMLAALLGLAAADFLSGMIHWACDTWGTPKTPIVGALAIRTFREHHVDQHAILRHDFVEVNGHNFALSIVLSVCGLWTDAPFARVTLLCAAIAISLTSQIHQWAHMERAPRIVRVLQRARIILSPEHHAVHHAAPHTRNFCITTGWLDRPFHAMRFFESLEAICTASTGFEPRRDETSP